MPTTKRQTCKCTAYPWPHRPGGGLCHWPDPPAASWQGEPGKNRPTAIRRRGERKRLCQQYKLHPIRDREKIERRLPRLYAAHDKRYGRLRMPKSRYSLQELKQRLQELVRLMDAFSERHWAARAGPADDDASRYPADHLRDSPHTPAYPTAQNCRA
jgi:hypothetical protein